LIACVELPHQMSFLKQYGPTFVHCAGLLGLQLIIVVSKLLKRHALENQAHGTSAASTLRGCQQIKSTVRSGLLIWEGPFLARLNGLSSRGLYGP